METVAEAGGSKANELGDMQKKRKRSGKKKKQENALKNDGEDSQNGNAYEAGSSKETEKSTTLPSEPCQRDSVSLEEPGATLHHKDSSSPPGQDLVPDANVNGDGRRRSKRLEKINKKKEDSSLEEKMLDVAENTANEAQESSAEQLCTGPDMSTREDLRPDADATDLTCSQGRKRKKERKRNTQKETGVDINSTNAQVAANCNIVSEAEGSKSVNIEEKSGASVVITTVQQQESTNVELNETVSQTESPKAKKKKKRRKTKTMDVCDPLENTLASTIEDSATEKDTLLNAESTKKKKKDKKKKVDQDALGSEGISKVEIKTTEDSATEKDTLLNAESTKKKKKDKKKKVDQAAVGSEGISKVEIKTTEASATEKDILLNVESTKKKRKDKKKEVDQEDALGSEGISKVEIKTTEDSATEKDTLLNAESTKKKKKDKKKKVDQDGLGSEGISKVEIKTTEDSATETDTLLNVESTKKKKKDKKEEVDQDALGSEGISKVEIKTTEDSATEGNLKNAKTKKKDIKSKRNALEAAGVSMVEEKSVQNDKVTKKKKKNKMVEVGDDVLEAEGVSTVEEKSVQNDKVTKKKKKNKTVEVVDDAFEAEGVSKAVVKTEKKKKKKSKKERSSLDRNTDNMEEKDDVSLPRNDEELDSNKEKLETSLSSAVLIHSNVAQGVAPPEIVDVPTCSCTGQRTKKLIVFDLNGILADVVQGLTGGPIPDGRVAGRSVFLRPFVHSFLDFCFERFDIGIWSSRRIGLDYMTNLVMKSHARNLLFCLGQNACITTRFKTLENWTKPLFLKDLTRVWERFGTCFTCGKRKYDETNTLLVDDSPDKSLCNPPYTGIFPRSYQYTDREDYALGPEGELRKYLERLADATSVQKFVAENPYGQAAITETHESWGFYSKVFEAYSCRK